MTARPTLKMDSTLKEMVMVHSSLRPQQLQQRRSADMLDKRTNLVLEEMQQQEECRQQEGHIQASQPHRLRTEATDTRPNL